MATEGIAFEWINQYIELRKQGIKINLSANSEDLFEDLSALFDDAVNFTPNLYYPQKTEHSCSINEYRNCEHEIHIGIFGALRPLKNHLKQAIWAIEYGKKLNRPVVVHINATEHESSNPQTGSVIRNVRNLFKSNENRLVEHPWYPHKDFLNVVSKMDFGLQVSFSETFNITAADFVYMGVPIIVSDEVKFVNPLSRLNNSTSNEEALETIELTTSFISCGLGMMNRYLLNKSNSKSVECWKNLLIA
jgi:hypothetical protein